ncbi:unnamed protein product [Meloidogyne enterolobii]|uniref:Uncharacterized protein n=1 Tax=Meloidogyne enterolobii TaxID=390850 RepID=A0ACB0YS37_MELEN
MHSLPQEVQLDVLKCLNFNELFSLKLTNFYFLNLINKYEGELARKKFRHLSLIKISLNDNRLSPDKFFDPQSGTFEFTLTDQLKEKWQKAIDKSIPLSLNSSKSERTIFVRIEEISYLLDKKNLLNLPNFPKNIDEMIEIRCWLEQLFNCAYDRVCFDGNLFNPEMINILFDNDNTIPPQFNVNELILSANNTTFEIVLKFSLNYLSISEFICINLDIDFTEQRTDILFDILINDGHKFPKICLKYVKLDLYDQIMKVCS